MDSSTYALPARRSWLSWLPVVFPAVGGALFLSAAMAGGGAWWLAVVGAAFLLVAGMLAWFRRLQVDRETITATLRDDRLEMAYRGRSQSLRWTDVIAVREQGDILRFETGDGDGVGMVVNPAWPRRAEFVEDLAAHLDASRGYTHLACDVELPGAPEHACVNPLGCAGQAGCQGHATA